MAARLRILGPRRIGTLSGRSVSPPPKAVDPFYLSPEYVRWREAVFARAGGRCEVVERGVRCAKAAPAHRMFADHVVEVKDGGARFDPDNGELKCGAHHSRKTALARARRR